jgi:hypothetical protein
MFQKNSKDNSDISAETFAVYNQNLYYNDQLHEDSFVPVENPENAKVTVSEVQHVLSKHFKANKSTGLSCLPL